MANIKQTYLCNEKSLTFVSPADIIAEVSLYDNMKNDISNIELKVIIFINY